MLGFKCLFCTYFEQTATATMTGAAKFVPVAVNGLSAMTVTATGTNCAPDFVAVVARDCLT